VPALNQVAIAYAPDYASVPSAMRYAANLIGGIGSLVRNKTVAIKVNVTGWGDQLFGLPATETYVVHGAVVAALTALLVEAGASSIRILESAATRMDLGSFVRSIGWDTDAIAGTGHVEFINTRNGDSGRYATLTVPHGRIFDAFEVHPAYMECDVFISLAKMKNHRTAGVTLTLKNLFGIPPNSRYGQDAPSEDATGLRYLIHDRRGSSSPLLPGEREEYSDQPAEIRIPRVITDVCSARRIDLAIVEGVTTIAGGEGPWHESTGELQVLRPGVLIMGRDALATDVVSTAVMGYPDPMSEQLPPFTFCENHLRLAREVGIGIGDLAGIDVRGQSVAQVRTPFAWL
jgi:uncharacterized protein (DUF362 family)